MLQIATLLASLTVIGVMPASALLAPPTIRLDSATVTGVGSESVNKFLGIPYAQPPTCHLRFQLPLALPPYDNDLLATDHGPACPQHGALRDDLFSADNVTYSEDCLTLNVVTPRDATPTSKLPVVVWIHGGGFETGHKSEPQYDGKAIVDTSTSLGVPVVYAAINYRLNLFGFLAGKEIKDADVGNLGLHDQRLALKWIQKYISAFGGDPTKVTIWGESAGAMSIGFHMLANGGNPDGLFRAAFMQSGTPIHGGDMAAGQKYYDTLVELAGCSNSKDTLQCLRSAPYQTLLSALPEVSANGTLKKPWIPRVDGMFLTANPYELVRQKAIADIPFINGVCDDEGTMFATQPAKTIFTDEEFEQHLRTNWMANSSEDRVKQVMALYPSDPELGSPFDTGLNNILTPQYKRLAAFNGDLFFQGPRRFFLQNLASRQSAWTYLSKRHKAVPFLGAAHTFDLDNVFKGGDMASYLVRFATNLDPNIGQSSDIYWPQYHSVTPMMLVFADGNTPSGARNAPLDRADQIPIQVQQVEPEQALIHDVYRYTEIDYLFTVAEENPF